MTTGKPQKENHSAGVSNTTTNNNKQQQQQQHQQLLQNEHVVPPPPPPKASYPSAPPPQFPTSHSAVTVPAAYAPQPLPASAVPYPLSTASPAAAASASGPNKPIYVTRIPQGTNAVIVQTVNNIEDNRLPCCGTGAGWFLFILGWFLGIIPWYIGALILCCGKLHRRERAGHIACAIMAVLVTVISLHKAKQLTATDDTDIDQDM